MTTQLNQSEKAVGFSCMRLISMKQLFQHRSTISMKITKQLFLPRRLWIVGLFLMFLLISTLWAAEVDAEPNNSCEAAQNIGQATLPLAIDGLLESNSSDYFRLTGVAGSVIKVDSHGLGSEGERQPVIEVLDRNCQRLVRSSYYSIKSPSLVFTIPESGFYTLVVTHCCTNDVGAQVASGAWSYYQLSVIKQKSIASITGTLMNA